MRNGFMNEIIERIVDGGIAPAEGARRLGIPPEAVAELLRRRALEGREAFAGPAPRRLLRHLAGRLAAARDALRAYPTVAGIKMRVAGALASFALASVGVVMLTASTSVFPAALFAGSGPDTVRMRLESNMSFKNAAGVENQIRRAGSVYDRMDAVLAGENGDHASLRKAIAERRRALDQVRLNYIKHGANVPVNEAFRHKEGDLYARMLEAFPAQELKMPAGLSAVILERAQNADRKLAGVRAFYAETLRRRAPKGLPATAPAPSAKPAAPAAGTVTAAAPAPEPLTAGAYHARIAELAEEMKARRAAGRSAVKPYLPFTRMPVISRFHRRTLIERAVGTAALPPLETADQMRM